MRPIYRKGVKLPSRCPILYLLNKYPYWIFQTCCIISIFVSLKCRLFHNATLFGFCITHILNTGVLKFEKKKSVAKRLILKFSSFWPQCVLYDSQNKQLLFRQTELSGWFLYWRLTYLWGTDWSVSLRKEHSNSNTNSNLWAFTCFTPLYKIKRNFSTTNVLLILLNGSNTLLCVSLFYTHYVPRSEAMAILVCIFFFFSVYVSGSNMFWHLLTWQLFSDCTRLFP